MPDNSKLTDEQLSLMIAEFLEPNPDFTTFRSRTESGCWLRFQGLKASVGLCDEVPPGTPYPNDMVNNPAMTVMLMKRDQFVSLGLDEGVYHVTFCGNKVHDLDCNNFLDAEDADLGRAVCLAFIAANNLGLETKGEH